MVDYDKLFNEAESKGQTKQIVPQVWEWQNKGDFVIGMLEGIESVEGESNNFNAYTLDTKVGLIRVTLGVKQDKLITESMLGAILKITYLGKVITRKGREANEFDIQIADVNPNTVKKAGK